MRVDEERRVDYSRGGVLKYRVRECVVESSPVCEGVGPGVRAEEVLSVNCGGYVGEDGLDVFVELVGLGRAERRVIIAAKDARSESACGEEADDAIEVVEEGFLVAGLDWVAEEVFAARIAECDELAVSFDALRADGADVVVANALSDVPLRVIPIIYGWCGLRGGG